MNHYADITIRYTAPSGDVEVTTRTIEYKGRDFQGKVFDLVEELYPNHTLIDLQSNNVVLVS